MLSERGAVASTPLRAAPARAASASRGPDDGERGRCSRRADVARRRAPTAPRPAPALLLRALGAGARARSPRACRVYEEVLDDGERGLLFEPGDAETLAAQLERLLARRRRCASACARPRPARELAWSASPTSSRRSTPRSPRAATTAAATRAVRARLAQPPLHRRRPAHAHRPLAATARRRSRCCSRPRATRGSGAIAVTDHNEISGALEAREKAAEFGVKVIVGEEVKTADQGEVIGLFLTEQIPRGLTLQETVAEIKRQGGARLRPAPVRPHARGARLRAPARRSSTTSTRSRSSTRASPSARSTRRPSASRPSTASSRAPARTRTSRQGLGSVRIRMRDFDGPEEFLESLREADIVAQPSSLLYVQALKFLQTKATPPGAARRAAQRRAASAAPHASRDAGAGTAGEPSNLPATPCRPLTTRSARSTSSARSASSTTLTRELQACQHCPRGNLMPVLGSGHPQADVFLLKHAPRPSRDRGGRGVLRPRGHGADEVAQAPGHRPARRLRDAVREVPGRRPVAGRPGCVARMVEELAIVQPKIVVVMGEDALASSTSSRSRSRGRSTPTPGRRSSS